MLPAQIVLPPSVFSAVYKSSDEFFFSLLIRGTERQIATFRHCNKQRLIEIITKSKDQALNKVSASSFEWFVFLHGINGHNVFVGIPSNADQIYYNVLSAVWTLILMAPIHDR